MNLYTFNSDGELLVHSGLPYRSSGKELSGHKYLLRVRLPNGNYRYFYKKEEIQAYYKEKIQREKDAKAGRYRPDVNLTSAHKVAHAPSSRTGSSRSDSLTDEKASEKVDAKTYKSVKEEMKANLKKSKENLKEVKKTNPDKDIRVNGKPVSAPTKGDLYNREDYQKRLDEAEKQVEEAQKAYDAAKKLDKEFLDPDTKKKAQNTILNMLWNK